MRPGFTLMELMVVLALITLTSAVTVPRLIDSASDPLTRGSDQAIALLNKVRLRAARSGSSHSVTVDPSTGQYWVEDVNARVVELDTLELPSEVRLTANKARLRFRFTPTGEVAADTVVLLAGDGARRITAEVWTGEIRAW